MFRKKFAYSLFVSIFALASTFFCGAHITLASQTDHLHVMMTQHDCCPQDGHKGQIQIKSTLQSLQKESFSSTTIVPECPQILRNEDTQCIKISPIEPLPRRDRQAFFFTDTIRLLL